MLEEFKEKKILILGLGKEGTSTLRFIRKKFPNKIIGIADQKTKKQLDKYLQKIIEKDKKLLLHLGKKYLESLNLYEVVFKSPGVQLPKSSTAKSHHRQQFLLKTSGRKLSE